MIKVSCCIPGKLPPEAGMVAKSQYERLLFGYRSFHEDAMNAAKRLKAILQG